jgi:hypothetical protein
MNHLTSILTFRRLATLVLTAGGTASAQIGTNYCTPAPNSTGNELAGFVFDATGTRNVLTHNGAVLTGTNRAVPCPPADCNGE